MIDFQLYIFIIFFVFLTILSLTSFLCWAILHEGGKKKIKLQLEIEALKKVKPVTHLTHKYNLIVYITIMRR